MAGTVYLAGGGSPADESEVWRDAYAGVGRVLYWPFALEGAMLDTSDDWFRTALRELGLAPEVTTWTTLEGHDSVDLESFDLLVVTPSGCWITSGARDSSVRSGHSSRRVAATTGEAPAQSSLAAISGRRWAVIRTSSGSPTSPLWAWCRHGSWNRTTGVMKNPARPSGSGFLES